REAGPVVTRRLYLQIYVAFLWVAAVSVVCSGVLASVLFGRPVLTMIEQSVIMAASVAVTPSTDPALADRMGTLSERYDQDLTLYDRDGHLIGSTGTPQPDGGSGPFANRAGVGLRVTLPDQRTLVIGRSTDPVRRHELVAWLLLVAGGIAVGSLPIA